MSSQKYRRASKTLERKKRRPVALVIVENDELNESICDCLSEVDFDCVQAFSGHEGVEFVRTQQERPGLVVIDGSLEDMHSFQCCACIKLHPDMNMVPVIMLLEQPIEEIPLQGLRIEAESYLRQPLSTTTLSKQAVELVRETRKQRASGRSFHIALTFESNLKLLDQVNVVLNRALQNTKLNDVEEQKIKYVTQEMGRNAIEWGNRNATDFKVRLILCIEKDRFWARIIDEGEGFDPNDIPHAADPEDPIAHLGLRQQLGMRDGGFGILVAREFMDEVAYNETGNEVLIVKYLGKKAKSS